jgi:hypothetical protein
VGLPGDDSDEVEESRLLENESGWEHLTSHPERSATSSGLWGRFSSFQHQYDSRPECRSSQNGNGDYFDVSWKDSIT